MKWHTVFSCVIQKLCWQLSIISLLFINGDAVITDINITFRYPINQENREVEYRLSDLLLLLVSMCCSPVIRDVVSTSSWSGALLALLGVNQLGHPYLTVLKPRLLVLELLGKLLPEQTASNEDKEQVFLFFFVLFTATCHRSLVSI